jgi:hypothetical protein
MEHAVDFESCLHAFVYCGQRHRDRAAKRTPEGRDSCDIDMILANAFRPAWTTTVILGADTRQDATRSRYANCAVPRGGERYRNNWRLVLKTQPNLRSFRLTSDACCCARNPGAE